MYEYVCRHLQETKGTWPAIASESGVPFRTLEKIGRGETKDPGISTVQQLFDYFRGRDSRPVRAPGLRA